MSRMTHRLWLPEEDRIVDRHARALARGRYRFASDAVRACLHDFRQLRLRPGRRAGGGAASGRSFGVTHIRLKKRMADLGLPWVAEALTGDEERIVQRHLREFGMGRFDNVPLAAASCRREIARLPVGRRSWQPRRLSALITLLTKRLHATATSWGGAKWTAGEEAVALRWARALAEGRVPDSRTAAVKCRGELARLGGAAVGRSLDGVAHRIRRLARDAGWPLFYRPWRTEELRILDRYVAVLVEGRFESAKSAAAACTPELARLHRKMLRRDPERYAGTLPRSNGAVLKGLNSRARELGLPRYGDRWTPAERRVLERHARGVPAGRYRSWKEAARVCHGELAEARERVRRNSPIALRVLPARKLLEVHKQIIVLSHVLDLKGPRRVLWTPAEDRVCDSWIRWYERHRHVRRYRPAQVAAEGFSEDLGKIGCERTPIACRNHFYRRRRLLLGMG